MTRGVRVAIVSASEARGLDSDEPLLVDAFRAAGLDCSVVNWHDATIDWSSFDLAVVRSTWDYHDRLDAFLAWIHHVAGVTTLVNSPHVIEWNANKWYLAELERFGIPIVPTTFVPPGAEYHVDSNINGDHDANGDGVFVVKPSVGAGSNGAKRCRADEVSAHVDVLHRAGKTAMVQPYLSLLDEHGERAVCFVPDGDGRLGYSHTFSKAAILGVADVERVGELFAAEEIGPSEPDPAAMALAERVLSSPPVARLDPLAYARVDIAPTPAGPVVMELELIEPSLYLHVATAAAERFAAGLVAFAAL